MLDIPNKILILPGIRRISLLIHLERPRLRLKFKDRISASRVLAEILSDRISRISEGSNQSTAKVVVVGIPRGGLLVASQIAVLLSAPLDFLMCKRIILPDSGDLTLGSVCEDNSIYVNERLVEALGISKSSIQDQAINATKSVKEEAKEYRQSSLFHQHPELTDRIVILVDDGAASGCTLIKAAQSIREKHPRRLIIALPVAPKETIRALRKEAHSVEFISSPSNFSAVSHYYQDFTPVSQKHIINLLRCDTIESLSERHHKM
jgi:putative phosphoribosyl transferase